MAGVAARLVRALHKCNISDAIWLPRRGGLLMCGLAIPVGAALM